MRRSFLLVAAAALPALSAAAWGQAPREQRMTFGGGGYFEFAIPANAQGDIYVDATWAPGAPMHAWLFAPGHPHPIAEADGTGRLTIAQPVRRWEAGTPYVLRIAAVSRGVNLRGSLRVVYPSGNRPDVAVQWRNAGPTDVAVLGQMARRVERLRSTVRAANMLTSTAPGDVVLVGSSTAPAEIIEALQTRIDVLVHTPSRYVRNTDGLAPATAAGAASGALPGARTLAVGFDAMRIETLSPFHTDHERDAVYVVAAVLPAGTARAACGRTPVMRSLEGGDVVRAANGGQELARAGTARAQLAVAVLEREEGNPDFAMARFLDAAELYRIYSATDGPAGGDVDFAWFTEVALGSVGERVVGVPMLLQVTEGGIVDPSGHVAAWTGDGTGGRIATPRLGFAGGGAKVDVALTVHTND